MTEQEKTQKVYYWLYRLSLVLGLFCFFLAILKWMPTQEVFDLHEACLKGNLTPKSRCQVEKGTILSSFARTLSKPLFDAYKEMFFAIGLSFFGFAPALILHLNKRNFYKIFTKKSN